MTINSIIYSQERTFKHYGLLEGLPQETIRCMDQDSLGFLWLGSSDGVSRFDGTNFFVPPEDKNNQADLSGFKIESILSYKSNVFVGTAQNGLYVYNIEDETTKSIGLPNTKCSSITNVGQYIYITYYNAGVYRIEEDFSITPVVFKQGIPKKITSLKQFRNQVFVGTDSPILYYFNSNSNIETEVNLQQIPIPFNGVNRLEIIENTLWICSTNGLYRFVPKTNEVELISLIDYYEGSENEPSIFDIVNFENSFFVASSVGLFEMNQATPTSAFKFKNSYVASKKDNEKSVSFSGSNDLLIRDNLLFIGGINLDVTKIKHQEVFKNSIIKYDLDNPSVFGLVCSDKYIFTGTSSGLIISEIKNASHFINLENYKIRGITIDNNNHIWMITGSGAFVIPLDNFNLEKPEIIAIPSDKKDINTLSATNLRSVYKDLQGTIWITTFKNGINRFTGNISEKKYTFQQFAVGEESNKLPSSFTLSISQDTLNNYWITTQKGLSKLTFKNNDFSKPDYTTYNQTNGLATNGVLSSFVDKNNVLWVATRKGLSKYLRKEDKFISFGKREGLSNAFVYHILEDDFNNLWLSTNGGLFKFDKKTKSFANYTPKDGVQSLEFNLGASYKNTQTGTLYFGGINGLNIFNPSQIDKLDKESKIQFTTLKIRDTLINPKNFEGLDESISVTKKLILNYKDFPLDLSFAALDYRPNKNIQYVYKLLPEDKQWNNLKDKNNLLLLTLSPKKYTLQIQGMSRGKLWSNPPLELTIIVKPPWYRSNIAYLLYAIAFLTLVYFYYKIILQRKLASKESQRLQDLDDLKSRFITNITHEFRTPLTIILGYLSNLKEEYSTKKDTIDSLETIEKNSNNLLGLVNQMLDLAKLEQGKLKLNTKNNDAVAFIQHIVHSFDKIAEEKNIHLTFSSTEKEIKMDYDAEKLRQIITNLLSNALKFTSEGKKVNLELSVLQKGSFSELKIAVKDQGVGIPQDELPNIFDRFYQVSSSNFKVAQGTGIGLALCKELVGLMKGSISVVSEVNKGSTFTVQLPITQEALFEDVNLENIQVSIGKTEVLAPKEAINKDTDNHILIVEDNTDMANYISSCLSESYQITHALDGSKGLEKAIEETPDLIISDVMMPIMDGFEMTQKLQKLEATNHIPIILLTSKAMQEDKIEGLESGADAYLTKPFSKKELQIRIANLIAKRKQLQKRYQIELVVQEKKKEQACTDKNIIFLNKAIDCIHQFMEDSSFNSEKLAKELGLSDSQLYRKLKAISNTSTAIFIRNIRLEKAKELLLDTSLSISEIAYAIGFNDPSWFSKTFKTAFGKSPLSFRQE